MNLAKLIHERWATDAALSALLPVSSVSTGIYFAADPTVPYATITRPGDFVVGRSSDGVRIESVPVRITIYHDLDHYDEGEAIADAVKAAFDGSAFDLATEQRVVAMRLVRYQPLQDDDGDWYFILDFECTVSV